MYQDGTRRKTLFRRTGRPRSKWHTVTRKHTIKHLIDKNVILRLWQNHIRDNEFDHLIVGAAEHRVLITKVPYGSPVRGSYQATTRTQFEQHQLHSRTTYGETHNLFYDNLSLNNLLNTPSFNYPY